MTPIIDNSNMGKLMQLEGEIAELKQKLAQAEAQNCKQLEIQQQLSAINNNYLMLHYLNKNIQECHSSQQVWETYLKNMGEGGFNYPQVTVLLPNEKGQFCQWLFLQDEKLVREVRDAGPCEAYVLQAIQSKEATPSPDNLQVAVPMVNHCGDVLAILWAARKQGIFFEDIQLLEVYVQQNIATIENIMLNEKLTFYQDLLGKRMDQFVMLHYIAQEINAACGYYDLLKRYLQTLCSPLGFNFKHAVLYVPEEGQFQKASLAEDRLKLEQVHHIDNELAAQALAQQSTLLQENREVALPLSFSGKVNAIIYAQSAAVIESDQVQILETFAIQTSATLENTRLNTHLEYISFHDPLTKLYNRVYFDNQMKRIANKKLFPAGLIVCDLDGLKMINDNMGHPTGDELIKDAARLIQVSATEHIVARIGGDEFAILMLRSGMAEVQAVAEYLKAVLREYNLKNRNIPVWISIGWAASESATSMSELFKAADLNMYEEKVKYGPVHRQEIAEAIGRIQSLSSS